jgi:dimethylglycine dehydrogenase
MERLLRLYEALFERGESLGIADFGLYAINSLRMEKAYRGWGHELTNEVTLIEADMERFFAPDKGAFRGREATLAAKTSPQPRRLVYLEVAAGDADPRGAESVWAGGRMVGLTTSGAHGHRTGRSFAFAYVDREVIDAGTPLAVNVLGRHMGASVLWRPAYDPDNERLRA